MLRISFINTRRRHRTFQFSPFSLNVRRRHHTFPFSLFTFHFFYYLCPIMRIMRSRTSMRTRINIREDNNRYKQYNTKNYAVSRQVFT